MSRNANNQYFMPNPFRTAGNVNFHPLFFGLVPRAVFLQLETIMRFLPFFFLVTDIGFILYWVITLIGIIPADYLFKDYNNPILSAWNWSFLPLDLFISFSGLYSLRLRAKGLPWKNVALISLVLTLCSGLQAVSFWAIRRDFDLAWWTPNLFLFLYPIYFIAAILRGSRD